MDTSESYEPQSQQQQQQQQPQLIDQTMQLQMQHHQQQQQTMFPISSSSNGFTFEQLHSNEDEMIDQQMQSTAIPLPAPPSYDTSLTQCAATSGTTTTAAAQAPDPAPPTATTSNEFDIDPGLLQQFSCLGTTDHDDLVNQFQSLMNNQMSKDSARFFLEMSNWNLQTAVGCYLDFCNFQALPSMKILKQSRLSGWKQAWRLQNDGNEDWPNGCYLMSPNQTQRIQVPVIRPGDTFDIVADIPPTQPAVMWRLCTPGGWYFGETIWMIPPGDTATELADRMSQLRTTNTINPECVPQVNVVIMVNME